MIWEKAKQKKELARDKRREGRKSTMKSSVLMVLCIVFYSVIFLSFLEEWYNKKQMEAVEQMKKLWTWGGRVRSQQVGTTEGRTCETKCVPLRSSQENQLQSVVRERCMIYEADPWEFKSPQLWEVSDHKTHWAEGEKSEESHHMAVKV